MTLDRDAAWHSIEALGAALGLSPLATAWGIHEIANENMALAARVHLVEKGRDPARFAMVAFGGAGPTHAQAVARKLGVERVIIPRNAGVMSAVGLLTAPIRVDLTRTLIMSLADADWRAVERLFAAMEAEACAFMALRSLDGMRVRRAADMRYRGQGSEITVPLPDGVLGDGLRPDVEGSFYRSYDEHYGRHLEGIPIEVLNWRLEVTGEPPELPGETGRRTLTAVVVRPIGQRKAYFAEEERFVTTQIYDHDSLVPDAMLYGPAIVQAREFAALVAPGQRCTVDRVNNLVLEVAPNGARGAQ
jgi:N-methylhydantoinase A/oxoprolinase/acetone carboxylase beta subunit